MFSDIYSPFHFFKKTLIRRHKTLSPPLKFYAAKFQILQFCWYSNSLQYFELGKKYNVYKIRIRNFEIFETANSPIKILKKPEYRRWGIGILKPEKPQKWNPRPKNSQKNPIKIMLADKCRIIYKVLVTEVLILLSKTF